MIAPGTVVIYAGQKFVKRREPTNPHPTLGIFQRPGDEEFIPYDEYVECMNGKRDVVNMCDFLPSEVEITDEILPLPNAATK